jgi:hypothetical protein
MAHQSCSVDKPKKGQRYKFVLNNVSYDRDECLIWPHAKAKAGYGVVSYNGKLHNAHRLMCFLAHGEPIGDLDAAHKCGIPACINPRHLYWASVSENMRDRYKHKTALRKLSEDQIVSIGNDKRSLREVADAFGVTKSYVCYIRNGRSKAFNAFSQT